MNLFLKDRPKNRDVSHRKIRVRVEGDVTPRTLAEVSKSLKISVKDKKCLTLFRKLKTKKGVSSWETKNKGVSF